MNHFKLNKIVFACFVLSTMVMTGCNRRSQVSSSSYASLTTEKSVSADTTMSSEMRLSVERQLVLQRVKDIYSVVKQDYTCHGGVFDSDLFDRAFCSKSWNNLLMQVRGKEAQTNTLFYEINPWSMTLYSGVIVSFEEFEVNNVTLDPEMRASVSFTVYENDTYTPARVDLVYEDGRWVIDNFHNLKYMMNVRTCMSQYLNTEMV